MNVFDGVAMFGKFAVEKANALDAGVCVMCNLPPANFSEEGEREYKISGTCERCFDDLFKPLGESL